MHIVVVGLSHRTAPVEVREKLSIPDQSISESLKTLSINSDILEVSILSTCNRLEIYALVKEINIGISSIKEFLTDYSSVNFEDLNPHLFDFRQEEAVLHLMKVSAGLDSLVLGEGQILSQVKKMMRLGQENESTGPILNRLLSQSVSAGKKVRSETNLGTGAVSISSAAVELAQLKIGQDHGVDGLVSLKSEKVLVVGAGRMSRTFSDFRLTSPSTP
jgi:glutamyl-tRNA reductase